MDTVTDVLLHALDEAFDHKSWHGTNLRGSLRGLSAVDAAWRPRPGQHNIWEIVVHAAYWKYVARRRLLGETRGAFPLEGSNWFRRPARRADPPTQWKSDVALLVTTHRALRAAVARLTPADIDEPAGNVSAQALVRGVAAHDLYHAGQIQLLKRLRADRTRQRSSHIPLNRVP